MSRDFFSRFLIVLAAGLLAAGASQAGVIAEVSMNTGLLVGHPAGPFSLNFQLNDGLGIGDANNTATLTNFQFGGGSAAGNPSGWGGAGGSLSGGITITDSSFANSFTEGFTPGLNLKFLMALTTNVDAGGVPDQFSFAILDSNGVELPTQSFFDVFLFIDIDSRLPAVQTFGSDPQRPPFLELAAPEVTAIPEPGMLVLSATGLLAVGLWSRRARRQKLR